MERTRCTLCRNPIKPHQAAAGPDMSYHEDCWPAAATALTTPAEQQQDYRRRIGEQGLAGLLSPYISVFPPQQHTFTVKPKGAEAAEAEPAPAEAQGPESDEDVPAQCSEPNFVML